MSEFAHKKGELRAEGVSVRKLAERYGTPLYVYSRNHIRAQYSALAAAMAEVKPLICFSMKANSNAAIIASLVEQGAGVDIVSGGELFRALAAGAEASKIVFAGVGKTREEIDAALRKGILFFTVESEQEAARISECAARLRRPGRIAFRVNPDIDAGTHKHISTGKKENKFGLSIESLPAVCETASRLPNIELVGLHMHIGSQILSAEPFGKAARKLAELCENLKKRHHSFKYIDIGGGIGIPYRKGEKPLSPTLYAAKVIPPLRKLGLSVVMEPGRYLVGNSAILVCRVQYVKRTDAKTFVVVDAGMNDLIRPALYEAYHEVVPVVAGRGTIHGDLVGPICESGDFIALDRDLPAARPGDLLAVKSAGAYGFSMASNYNSRPRPAEIMVDGTKAMVIRERETLKDLVRREIAPRPA